MQTPLSITIISAKLPSRDQRLCMVHEPEPPVPVH